MQKYIKSIIVKKVQGHFITIIILFNLYQLNVMLMLRSFHLCYINKYINNICVSYVQEDYRDLLEMQPQFHGPKLISLRQERTFQMMLQHGLNGLSLNMGGTFVKTHVSFPYLSTLYTDQSVIYNQSNSVSPTKTKVLILSNRINTDEQTQYLHKKFIFFFKM